MIKLYYDPISVSCQKVIIVLEELSLAWEGEYINLFEGGQHCDSFRKLNDQSQVPVLKDDDGWNISESAVINEYLVSTVPGQQLIPENDRLKAVMQLLVTRISESLQQACGYLTYAILARPFLLLQPRDEVLQNIARTVDPVARKNRLECFENGVESPEFDQSILNHVKIFKEIDQRLQANKWICGDSYSLADVTLFPYLLRLEHLGIIDPFNRYKHIIDWYSRCKNRPSYKRAILDTVPKGFAEMGQEAGSVLTPKVASIINTVF